MLLASDLSGPITTRSVRLTRMGPEGVSAEQVFSSAEMERMMKVQEVILKTMAGSPVAEEPPVDRS